MHTFGTTRTRTQLSTMDQEAMGTTDMARLRELCNMGSQLACRNANIAPLSAEKKAEMARNREADAVAQRAATAKRLIDAGVNPQIAESVRTGRDVFYAPSTTSINASDFQPPSRLCRIAPLRKVLRFLGLACTGPGTDMEEAERQLRENLPQHMADELMDDLHHLNTPWYGRTSTWLIASAAFVVVLSFIALR